MGWWDKVKAAKAEVAKVAKEVTEAIADEVEDGFGDQDWYQGVKGAGQSLGEFGKEVWEEGTELVGDTLDELGKTEGGKMLGEKSTHVVGFLSKLPVLSLATDIMRARNGIDGLYEHLKADPNDPERFLWLAEAMDRMDRDQHRYTTIRSAMDPSYLLTRQAIKTSTELGKEAIEAPRRRLLKNAFALSISRLKKKPSDRDAIHVLARVYLAQKLLSESMRFSKLAIIADPNDGLALVTLGRVYLAHDQLENARRAGQLAIERGSSMGNEILAEVLLKENAGDAPARIERYSDILDQVSQQDRERYWGPSVQGVNMVEAIGAAQMKKATDLLERW
jgi:hypothetical protein